MNKQKQKGEVESKNILVKAMESIGVAYGKNQTKGQLCNVDDWF